MPATSPEDYCAVLIATIYCAEFFGNVTGDVSGDCLLNKLSIARQLNLPPSRGRCIPDTSALERQPLTQRSTDKKGEELKISRNRFQVQPVPISHCLILLFRCRSQLANPIKAIPAQGPAIEKHRQQGREIGETERCKRFRVNKSRPLCNKKFVAERLFHTRLTQ